MRNKLIKIACICLMLLSLSIIFTGCKESKGQITIAQIEEVLINAKKPTFEGASSVNNLVEVKNLNGSSEELEIYTDDCIKWQMNFEDNNIDSSDFMSMSKLRYNVYYNQADVRYYYIYVFKFTESDDAEDCYKKLNKVNIVENDDYKNTADYSNGAYKNYKYKAKQYGNLVVYVYNEIANYIFDLIDDIKVK